MKEVFLSLIREIGDEVDNIHITYEKCCRNLLIEELTEKFCIFLRGKAKDQKPRDTISKGLFVFLDLFLNSISEESCCEQPDSIIHENQNMHNGLKRALILSKQLLAHVKNVSDVDVSEIYYHRVIKACDILISQCFGHVLSRYKEIYTLTVLRTMFILHKESVACVIERTLYQEDFQFLLSVKALMCMERSGLSGQGIQKILFRVNDMLNNMDEAKLQKLGFECIYLISERMTWEVGYVEILVETSLKNVCIINEGVDLSIGKILGSLFKSSIDLGNGEGENHSMKHVDVLIRKIIDTSVNKLGVLLELIECIPENILLRHLNKMTENILGELFLCTSSKVSRIIGLIYVRLLKLDEQVASEWISLVLSIMKKVFSGSNADTLESIQKVVRVIITENPYSIQELLVASDKLYSIVLIVIVMKEARSLGLFNNIYVSYSSQVRNMVVSVMYYVLNDVLNYNQSQDHMTQISRCFGVELRHFLWVRSLLCSFVCETKTVSSLNRFDTIILQAFLLTEACNNDRCARQKILYYVEKFILRVKSVLTTRQTQHSLENDIFDYTCVKLLEDSVDAWVYAENLILWILDFVKIHIKERRSYQSVIFSLTLLKVLKDHLVDTGIDAISSALENVWTTLREEFISLMFMGYDDIAEISCHEFLSSMDDPFLVSSDFKNHISFIMSKCTSQNYHVYVPGSMLLCLAYTTYPHRLAMELTDLEEIVNPLESIMGFIWNRINQHRGDYHDRYACTGLLNVYKSILMVGEDNKVLYRYNLQMVEYIEEVIGKEYVDNGLYAITSFVYRPEKYIDCLSEDGASKDSPKTGGYWRLLTECIEIMVYIITSVPIEKHPDDTGISVDRIVEYSDLIKRCVILTTHKGALGVMRTSFSKLCSYLVNRHCITVQRWIVEVFEKDLNDEKIYNLRKSIGLTTVVLSIVTSRWRPRKIVKFEVQGCKEDIQTHTPYLQFCLNSLIRLYSNGILSKQHRMIHSLNIISTLIQESRMAEDPDYVYYLTCFFRICRDALNSQDWCVRNSGLRLFSIIVRRIFGPSSQEEIGVYDNLSFLLNLRNNGGSLNVNSCLVKNNKNNFSVIYNTYKEILDMMLFEIKSYNNGKESNVIPYLIFISRVNPIHTKDYVESSIFIEYREHLMTFQCRDPFIGDLYSRCIETFILDSNFWTIYQKLSRRILETLKAILSSKGSGFSFLESNRTLNGRILQIERLFHMCNIYDNIDVISCFVRNLLETLSSHDMRNMSLVNLISIVRIVNSIIFKTHFSAIIKYNTHEKIIRMWNAIMEMTDQIEAYCIKLHEVVFKHLDNQFSELLQYEYLYFRICLGVLSTPSSRKGGLGTFHVEDSYIKIYKKVFLDLVLPLYVFCEVLERMGHCRMRFMDKVARDFSGVCKQTPLEVTEEYFRTMLVVFVTKYASYSCVFRIRFWCESIGNSRLRDPRYELGICSPSRDKTLGSKNLLNYIMRSLLSDTHPEKQHVINKYS